MNVPAYDGPPPKTNYRRVAARRGLTAAKAFVSLGALAYLASTVDARALSAALTSVHGGYLLLSVMQMLLIAPLGGTRWQWVLRRLDCDMPLWPLTRIFWIGMAFNQVLPSAVGGDALRIVLVHRCGLGAMKSATSVLVERAFMMLALVLIVVLTGLFAPGRALDRRLTMLAALLLCAGFAGLAALPMVESLLNRLSNKLRLVRFAVHLIKALRAVIFSSGAAPLILLCLATNLNLAVAAWWLSLGFGLPLTLLQVLAVVSTVSLAMVVPVSIGGWGVREAAMVALLTPLAVPRSIALLFSVTFGLAVAASSLPGLFLLWRLPRAGENELALVKAVD